MKPLVYYLLSFLVLSVMIAGMVGAQDTADQMTFSGKLLDGKNIGFRNGLVVATMNGAEYRTVTDYNGKFSLSLPSGPFDITYRADGFMPLSEKGITVPNTPIEKNLKKDSVGGAWVVSLALPGLLGLLVAWISEWRKLKKRRVSDTYRGSSVMFAGQSSVALLGQ